MPSARLLMVFALAACGGSSDPSTTSDATGDNPDAFVDPDGFVSLLSGGWNLQPGEEGYFCVYATVPEDTYIKGFRPIGPPGTHHTVLTTYSGTTPADGTVRCNVGTNGQNMIYGSGVGAPDFEFPATVGLFLRKGQRLLLNLHLYNATDNPLSGVSGTLYKPATVDEVPNLAELVLAGPTIGLNVPTGVSTQTGNCQLSNVANEPIHVFALSQHMHKLGTHMKSVITRAPELVLQDIPYNFEEQKFHLLDEHIQLMPNDTLRTECTFNNTTGGTVRFGESSDDEMCFTDIFYYPAQGADYICSGF
jgi:hypothetical protein